MCRTCGPRRLFVVESPGTFEISHRVGRSLCTFICSSIGVFFLSIAVVTLTLELSLPDCDYHNIGLSCWNEEDSEPRSGGFCGAAVCRSEYVVLEEDHIWTCAVKVPQCPYNGLNWQCPGQCMHEYEDGICSNALHESHEAGSSTLDSATNRTSTNSNNGSNSSSSPILPLPPTPPTPSPAVLMATNEGFWCTDLDCAPCADRVHPRGGVASWGWFTFGGILLVCQISSILPFEPTVLCDVCNMNTLRLVGGHFPSSIVPTADGGIDGRIFWRMQVRGHHSGYNPTRLAR
eukprot:SAG31_NODE_955_length_10799_cov_6.576636_8_plen_290_part_00